MPFSVFFNRIVSGLFLLFISGCASIYTQTHSAYEAAMTDCSHRATIPNVYSGTVFDFQCLPAENAGFFCLVDLPLSFAMDTLMVPYTAYRQFRYGSWYNQEVCQDVKKQTEPVSDPEATSG